MKDPDAAGGSFIHWQMSALSPRSEGVEAGQTPAPALAQELKDFVKSRIAPFKYPRWVEFVPELPKTATGKTQRFRLRQLGQTPQEEQ